MEEVGGAALLLKSPTREGAAELCWSRARRLQYLPGQTGRKECDDTLPESNVGAMTRSERLETTCCSKDIESPLAVDASKGFVVST
jgi:hypothetical protein